MKLEFLGTGGAFSDFRVNYHNNAIVETRDGYVMIDCGSTAVQSLKELGLKPWQMVGVIITHTHSDHVGGLEQLIWERVYTGATGPGWLRTIVYANPRVAKDIVRSVSPGIEEFTDRDGVCQSGGFHRLVEMHSVLTPFEIGGVKFTLHRTPHVMGPGVDKPSFGVEIEKDGRNVYYTSDTTFRPDIGDLFPGAEIIFHDCTFSPKYPGTVHTHYSDLVTLPPSVKKRTVLMHHTIVPDDVDPADGGFLGVAKRHEMFEVR